MTPHLLIAFRDADGVQRSASAEVPQEWLSPDAPFTGRLCINITQGHPKSVDYTPEPTGRVPLQRSS